MVRPQYTLVAAVCALALPVSSANSQGADLKKTLQARWDKLVSAIRNRDLKAYSALYAPKYESVQGQIRQKREQFLKSTGVFFKMLSSVDKVAMSVEKVSQKGAAAITNLVGIISVKITDTRAIFGPPGQIHDLRIAVSNRTTWTKSSGEWQIAKTEVWNERQNVTFLDGKRLDTPGFKE